MHITACTVVYLCGIADLRIMWFLTEAVWPAFFCNSSITYLIRCFICDAYKGEIRLSNGCVINPIILVVSFFMALSCMITFVLMDEYLILIYCYVPKEK